MKKWIVVYCIVLAMSCKQESKPEQGIVFKNDFENTLGWTDADPQRLMKGMAHSGNYSALTDPAHPYSLGFIRKMKDISDRPIKSIGFAIRFNT